MQVLRGRTDSLAMKASDSPKLEKKRPNSTRLVTWLLLGGITAIGAILRGARLDEAPGGFLVFNENFYLDLATREQARGLFAWFYNPLDLNNPPFYVALVSTIVRLGGPLLVSARLVSVLSGLATIALTFLLGRLLFDKRTGLVAAAAIAVMPGVVLVNHNIQVDSLFVALLLAGVFFYVRSARVGKISDAVLGGLFLGLALLTKQPAILALIALAVWRVWAQKQFSWLRERRTWAFALTTAVVGGSWYAFQLLFAPTRLLGAMVSVANRPEMLTIDGRFWANLGTQLVWMVFPLAAAVAVVGVVVMARRRESGDLLVFVFLAVYLAYDVPFHLHSYYLLPLAPFIALAIGRACIGAFDREAPAPALRIAGVSILIASMAFGSVMMMSGQKWGRWSPTDLRLEPDPGFSRVHLFYDPSMDGLFSSLEFAVDPQLSPTRVTAEEFVKEPIKPGIENLYLSPYIRTSSGTRVPSREDLTETWVRPVLFGFAVGQTRDATSRTQVFANSPWTAEPVGPWWQFGIQSVPYPTDYSIYSHLPQETGSPIEGAGAPK
jgi:hypothetical protein